jgi:hypothetical protein
MPIAKSKRDIKLGEELFAEYRYVCFSDSEMHVTEARESHRPNTRFDFNSEPDTPILAREDRPRSKN